jgi:hypothetical protein
LAVAALLSTLTACSSAPGGPGSAAGSAASSAIVSVASSAASAVQSAAASAASAISSRLAGIRNAVDARGDVSVGEKSMDSSGHVTAAITAANHTSKTVDYAVAVSFKDSAGNLLDAVMMTIDAGRPGLLQDRDRAQQPPLER